MVNHKIAVTENGTKTLLTAGKYCDRNVDVVVNVPSLDTSDATATPANIEYGKTAYVNGKKLTGTSRHKEYTGEIVSTVIGSDAYAVLAQDALLAELRNTESLFVRVEFDIGPTPYTVVKSWAANAVDTIIQDTVIHQQTVHRWDSSGKKSISYPKTLITDNTPKGVGSIIITEAGELRCYSNSTSNYAIRPCTYKVVIEW